MAANRLHHADSVTVTIYNNDGNLIATFSATGFSTVAEAVAAAEKSALPPDTDKRDFVYVVTNNTTHTSARYIINSGGNLRLVNEEKDYENV